MSLSLFAEHNKINWVGVRPGHYGEQILKSIFTENSEDTLYTVPSGSTFFLTGYSFTVRAGAAGTFKIIIYNDTPAVEAHLKYSYIAGNDIVSGENALYHPIELLEDWKINISSGIANLELQACIWGFLVDNDLL